MIRQRYASLIVQQEIENILIKIKKNKAVLALP